MEEGGDVEAHALEAAASLKAAGAKLVCIDFDATFVGVHTGGAWTQSAGALRLHVRRLFLRLVPLLCDADVHVAIVTFSPQVPLIREVLALCFGSELVQKLVVRGDDAAWTLAHADTVDFMPLWQTSGRHLDRHFKLPFLISAAIQAGQTLGEPVRNRDTVLIDDDAVNIRVANDSGVLGVYFDPEEPDAALFCRRIHRLHSQHQQPPTPVRTPCKKPRALRLSATPDSKFLGHGGGSGGKRRQRSTPGSGGRSSTFNLCTPSPVLKLRCNVDMGRPRSKRASRILRNYSRDMEEALPEVPTTTATCPLTVKAPETPPEASVALREPSEATGLSTPTV
ncbi:hypothetical protein BBJ28_00003030 [Nothophytophthora sp. Chile5]|nr:hypothetical protein BBJ28_00003030 [Nothophytophthora sp. Chile5]